MTKTLPECPLYALIVFGAFKPKPCSLQNKKENTDRI